MGYIHSTSRVFFGFDISGAFDTTKATLFDSTESGRRTLGYLSNISVSKKFSYGVSPYVGFLVADNVGLFVKLGVESNQWKAQASASSRQVNESDHIAFGVSAPVDVGATLAPTKYTKKSINLSPGLGVQFNYKKVFLRLGYNYVFGPTLKFQQPLSGISATVLNADYIHHSVKLSQHQVYAAVGYRF